MPPFGKRWFRFMKEIDHGNPIAHFRLHWVMLNVREDERLQAQRRKDEIEYGGFFANPEIYAHIKGLAEKSSGFQIVRDTSAYDRKVDAATRGEMPVVGKRREDIAALVRTKRDEARRSEKGRHRSQEREPDLVQGLELYPSDDLDSDDLTIEG